MKQASSFCSFRQRKKNTVAEVTKIGIATQREAEDGDVVLAFSTARYEAEKKNSFFLKMPPQFFCFLHMTKKYFSEENICYPISDHIFCNKLLKICVLNLAPTKAMKLFSFAVLFVFSYRKLSISFQQVLTFSFHQFPIRNFLTDLT